MIAGIAIFLLLLASVLFTLVYRDVFLRRLYRPAVNDAVRQAKQREDVEEALIRACTTAARVMPDDKHIWRELLQAAVELGPTASKYSEGYYELTFEQQGKNYQNANELVHRCLERTQNQDHLKRQEAAGEHRTG